MAIPTMLLPLVLVRPAPAAELHLGDLDALRDAVAGAAAGDVLVLAPGTYDLDQTLTLAAAGTASAPITLRGEGATLRVDEVEALKVTGPHWHVEGLRLEGVCADDSACEHALHIVGAADGTWVRGCTLVDFNAQIKGNGEQVEGAWTWPDDVVIAGNDLYDTRPRQTSNPVTKIDVVGGQRWRVEANRIADFEKGQGDRVSYAAFLKGHSKDGVLERNLVLCSAAFEGGVRVGLSLGGGGTSPDSICEDGTCTPEHERGTLRNNLVAGCSDVGVYLNEAQDTVVVANTLYRTSGIDVRFEASTAQVLFNVLDGQIRERDGGSATLGTNFAGIDLAAVFVDPDALDFTLWRDPGLVDGGTPVAGLEDDFCGRARDAAPDIGALEYTHADPCDTTTTHPDGDGGSGDGGGGDGGTGDGGTGDGGAGDGGTVDGGTVDGGTVDGGTVDGGTGDGGTGDGGGRDADGGDGDGADGDGADGGGGCGCASPAGAPGLPLGLLLLLARRRRRC